MSICIYCQNSDPTKFEGVEHVVPQAFGTYGSWTPTLDCVCDDCNGHFGRNHDEYLARETVEGVIRYQKGISSSEARPQKHLQITLDDGPEAGQFAGMKVAIDGTTGDLMPPKAQFQILNQKTGETEVYFDYQFPGLRLSEDVYGKPGIDSVEGTWKCKVFAASKEEFYEVAALLQGNGIAFVPSEPFLIPEPTDPDSDGKYSLPLLIQSEVTLQHRQAHAKIFLNLIAKCFGCDEAMNSKWDFLRRYARFAENPIKYRMAEKGAIPPEIEEKLRQEISESIIIQIFNVEENIIGSIQFYGNEIYQYILCENSFLSKELMFRFTNGKQPELLN